MANSLLDKLLACPAARSADICPGHILNNTQELARAAAKGFYVTPVEFAELTVLLDRIADRLRGGNLSTQLLENI